MSKRIPYNIGKDNPFYGKRHSEETKRKLSEINKKNPLRYWLGKKRPDIALQKLGKKLSPETIENLRISHLGQVKSPNAYSFPKGEPHPLWQGGEKTKKIRRIVNENNRRARKLNNGGTHSLEEWLALKIRYNFMCLCCKKKEPEIILTEDHIVPIIYGGANNISNIQPLCGAGNSRKNART